MDLTASKSTLQSFAPTLSSESALIVPENFDVCLRFLITRERLIKLLTFCAGFGRYFDRYIYNVNFKESKM